MKKTSRVRAAQLLVRFTETELAKVRKDAAKELLPVSIYVRRKLLGKGA